ncbi:hypothetical protein, partial [uncultured Rikenella sp.]|uniref:hypothetical protein n=1 Tax=uncultured Rikenella sp. TaxID=368003 RepID=UPI0026279674
IFSVGALIIRLIPKRATPENPAQPIGQTRPEHPAGMRSKVFLVLFVHKKNSTLPIIENRIKKA